MPRGLLDAENVFGVPECDLGVPGAAEEGVIYFLRPMTGEEARRIARKHTRTTRRDGDKPDFPAMQDAMLDYSLVRWEGIESDGQPAECTVENKRKLPVPIQSAIIERSQLGAEVDGEEESATPAESFRTPA